MYTYKSYYESKHSKESQIYTHEPLIKSNIQWTCKARLAKVKILVVNLLLYNDDEQSENICFKRIVESDLCKEKE